MNICIKWISTFSSECLTHTSKIYLLIHLFNLKRKSERYTILGKERVDTLFYIPPTKYNWKFKTLYKKQISRLWKEERRQSSEGPCNLWNCTVIISLVVLFAFYVF